MQLTDRFKTALDRANLIKLDHGLTLIHQYQPATPVAVVDVWIKAGSRLEPHPWLGMAHFLEHMIFKGTKQVSPRIFDQIVESNGGIANAATSYDYAHFFLTTASSYLPKTLPYLAEILLNAEIPEEEFIRERNVVLEEIRSCSDDPDWLGLQTLCESLYQRHPYGRSILGHETQLQNYSPQQMRCFHRTHYQPDNMTVVIVGDVQEKAALSLVDKNFSQFNSPEQCPSTLTEAEPPLLDIRRTQMYLPRLEQGRLLMGWIGPGVEHLKDGCGLDLLSTILAAGRSSRLVRELREQQQLVYDVESSFSLQKDSSLLTIGAWLAPQNLELVEQLIREQLEKLQINPVTEEELAKAKRLLCHDYIFSTETPNQLAGLYGYYQTIASAELCLAYPYIIKAFSALELQQIAHQYLSSERYAITVMQPC